MESASSRKMILALELSRLYLMNGTLGEVEIGSRCRASTTSLWGCDDVV